MTASDSAGFFTFANERDPPAVEDQHSVDVLSWRAVRAVSGDLHLMLVLESGALRNTSAVTFFDACRRALVTSSGRAYVLHGPPEHEAVTKWMLLANSARIGGDVPARGVSPQPGQAGMRGVLSVPLRTAESGQYH